MGRYSRGVQTVDSAMRLELTFLMKQGYLIKGQKVRSKIKWPNGCQIGLECDCRNYYDMFLRLSYIVTNQDGTNAHEDYKVKIEAIPSNLGRGYVLYFVCPVNGSLCRKLYLAYGSLVFKARTAYNNRLYYPQQKDSKVSRILSSPKYYEDKQKEFNLKRSYPTYKGKPTKRSVKRATNTQKLVNAIKKLNTVF